MHPCPLEEMDNHSCGMCFRPDSSAPKALHLRPHTPGDFFDMVIFKNDPERIFNIVDFLRVCSSKTETKPQNNIMMSEQIYFIHLKLRLKNHDLNF